MAESCTANNTVYLTHEEALGVTHSKGDTIFITIGIPLVSLFGIFNNLAFLYVIYRVSSMRNVTNFYLGNLAVADACILIIFSVRHLWMYAAISPINAGLPWKNPAACMLPYYFTYMTTYCSVFLVTLVSIERYFAICHPLRHRMFNGKRRAITLVFVTWLLSFLLAGFANSPTSTRQRCFVLPKDFAAGDGPIVVYWCMKYCTFCSKTIFIFDTAQFYIALFVSTVMYTLIVLKVSRRDIGESNVSNDVRNAVLRMVITNTVIFFLCLLPYKIINVQTLISRFGGNTFLSWDVYTLLQWIGRVTWLVNSAVNPLIYSLTNARYRRAFFEAFNLRKVKTVTINQTMQSQIHSVSQACASDAYKMNEIGNKA
ncbi:growth hormone secretagogue receptor type 1-like [Amphiura filiformis]|uniref:growth hormone secretagogue receptor type 1-like n=1 Tax=Amphiura filiformis TaxID=82378 RepID=UPI003B227FF6